MAVSAVEKSGRVLQVLFQLIIFNAAGPSKLHCRQTIEHVLRGKKIRFRKSFPNTEIHCLSAEELFISIDGGVAQLYVWFIKVSEHQQDI